jgi:hypothetical protein
MTTETKASQVGEGGMKRKVRRKESKVFIQQHGKDTGPVADVTYRTSPKVTCKGYTSSWPEPGAFLGIPLAAIS